MGMFYKLNQCHLSIQYANRNIYYIYYFTSIVQWNLKYFMDRSFIQLERTSKNAKGKGTTKKTRKLKYPGHIMRNNQRYSYNLYFKKKQKVRKELKDEGYCG